MSIKSVEIKIFRDKNYHSTKKFDSIRCALRQTDTKVTTVSILSGFQEFFLQPSIKDRPNRACHST